MDELTGHPSYLELDRQILGAASHPDTALHVARCERCARYLAQASESVAEPSWLLQLPAAELKRPARARRAPVWLAACASVACVVAVVSLRSGGDSEAYDTAKGRPAVAVYVNRHGIVSLWPGDEALLPGDRIRLEVAPDQYAHVHVFLEAGAQATLLYAGAVKSHARSLLPKTWELDAHADSEQLAVVFSERALQPEAAAALLRAATPVRAQVLRLSLPKRVPAQ